MPFNEVGTLSRHLFHHYSPMSYRTWLSVQIAPVAKAWCTMQVAVLLAAFMRAGWHSSSSSKSGDVEDVLAITMYIITYCAAGLVIICKPHMCEACFVGTTTMRIILSAIICIMCPTIPATFQLAIDLHADKVTEVLLMGPVEQVRPQWMIPLRALLMVGGGYVYAKQQKPYPWLSSLAVNGSAVLLMCLVERRYRRIFSRRAHRLSKDTGSPSPPGQYSPSSVASGCPSPQQVAIGLARGAGAALRRRLERAAATASSAAANGTGLCITAADCAQPLPGGLPVGGSSAVEANAAACAAEAEAGPQLDPGSAGGPEPQHGEAQLAAALLVQGGARGACGGIPAPVSGMSGAAGGGSVDASYELGLGVARKPHGRQLSTQVDAVTQARLQHLRQCLNRVRPKYVTHFRHHQASLKVPCQSHPGDLSPEALPKLKALVHNSRLLPMLSTPRAAAPCVACRDAEVEVLCAAMRAGCVMVALELQVPGAAASSGVESGRSKGGAGAAAAAGVLCSRDGSGKGGSSLGDLPQALAAAVRQWLLHTNLEAELQPGMPVVMQIDSLRFLCRPSGDGAGWILEGPTPLSSAPTPLPRIVAASPVALLPAHEPPPAAVPSAIHAGHSSDSSSAGASALGLELAVPAWVAVPPGTCLRGWAEGPTRPGADEAARGQGGSDGSGGGRGSSASAVWVGEGAGAEADILCAPSLSILARASGMYLPTRVRQAGAGLHGIGSSSCGGSTGDGTGLLDVASPGLRAQLVEVCISMPWALAHAPKPLRLELWEGQTLVGHGMVLLMPRHMVCVAQELQQRVPWGAHTDGADFLLDLSCWLSSANLAQPPQPPPLTTGCASAHSAAPAAVGVADGNSGAAVAAAAAGEAGAAAAAAEAAVGAARVAAAQGAARPPLARNSGLRWASGVSLLRQALLWGAPATADLLMDALMLRSGTDARARTAAFTCLAHATPGPQGCGVPAASGVCTEEAGSEGRQGDGELGQDPCGGLLHLALLSSNRAAALRVVLAWGRRWGAGDSEGGSDGSSDRGGEEQGFAWRWLEQNAAGLTPVEIAVGSIMPEGMLEHFGTEEAQMGGGSGSRTEAGRQQQRQQQQQQQQQQQHAWTQAEVGRAEAGLDLLKQCYSMEASQVESAVLQLLGPRWQPLPCAWESEQQQQQQQQQQQKQWEQSCASGQQHASLGSRGAGTSSGLGAGAPGPAASARPSTAAASACAPQSTGPSCPVAVAAAAAAAAIVPAESGSCSEAVVTQSQHGLYLPPAAARPASDAVSMGQQSLQEAVLACLRGFSHQSQVNEYAYRDWCKRSTASHANKYALIVIPLYIVSAIQSIRKQRYTNAAVMIGYIIPFFGVLLAGYHAPDKREFRMKIVKVTHWLVVVLFGLELLPTIIARKLALTHMDYVVECLLFRFVDQVQLQTLLLERLAQTFSISLLYSSLGMPWPLLQAVAINALSLAVGIAIDVHNRRTYMKMCSSTAPRPPCKDKDL